jgi:hypothetical protein
MQVPLAIIALLAAGYGVLSLSQATLGAGMIGVGCLLGILARLVQAADHQNQTKQAITEIGDMLADIADKVAPE